MPFEYYSWQQVWDEDFQHNCMLCVVDTDNKEREQMQHLQVPAEFRSEMKWKQTYVPILFSLHKSDRIFEWAKMNPNGVN